MNEQRSEEVWVVGFAGELHVYGLDQTWEVSVLEKVASVADPDFVVRKMAFGDGAGTSIQDLRDLFAKTGLDIPVHDHRQATSDSEGGDSV